MSGDDDKCCSNAGAKLVRSFALQQIKSSKSELPRLSTVGGMCIGVISVASCSLAQSGKGGRCGGQRGEVQDGWQEQRGCGDGVICAATTTGDEQC